MYHLLNGSGVFKPGDRVIAETNGMTYTVVVVEAYDLSGRLLLLHEDLGVVYTPTDTLKVKLANDRT